METLLFPAPLEVDRFLYFMSIDKISMERMFPAPREVDRFLYTQFNLFVWQPKLRFRPLSRWIGSYTAFQPADSTSSV